MDIVVKVINLFFKINKEQIELVFESYIKSGGSEDVKKVKYDEVVCYVIVWFKDFEGQLKNVGIVKLIQCYFIFEYLNYLKFIILKLLKIIKIQMVF